MRKLEPHLVLIPVLSTLAVLPLLVHGGSCGHDMPFHVQSWLEAAQQFKHGTLYPHWAYSPAWQAGEPRFVFYPPLSWMLGVLLTMFFAINWAPVAFTWVVLVGAAFSMYRLAREFSTAEASLFAAAVYLANPYMMFNALERGAFAELMAAIWVPLIFLAVLREHPSVRGLAVPLGLVWLTNAPAGVMSSYTIVLLALARLAVLIYQRKTFPSTREFRERFFSLSLKFAAGIALGLALVGFYLVPAAYERRFVQVDMAIIENLRYQDNFLFGRTHYEAHNIITRAISIQALTLVVITAVVLAMTFLLERKKVKPRTRISIDRTALIALAALTLVIVFLLVPQSAFIWEHLPNLKFMQFPWRLMSILSVALALALALLSRHLSWQRSASIASAATVLVLSLVGAHLYRQGCDPEDNPSFLKAAFDSGHGVLPTDEYTPLNADNDVARPNNPGFWLTEHDPNGPAPGTFQNPNEVDANYDAPMPFSKTVAERAPHHVSIVLARPEILVFNLRDYPSWQVSRNSNERPAHVHRDDGLLAIPLPAGPSTIDIAWHRSGDQQAGYALTACGLIGLAWTYRPSRKIVS